MVEDADSEIDTDVGRLSRAADTRVKRPALRLVGRLSRAADTRV